MSILLEEINKHWENDQLSCVHDVTIFCGPSRTPVHAIKAILSLCLDPFMSMLYGELLESTKNEVEIPDIEADVFRALIHNLFTSELVLDGVSPFPLYMAADKYLIGKLAARAKKASIESLSVDNVCELVGQCLAAGTAGEDVLDGCMKFIQRRYMNVLTSHAFPNCSESAAMAIVSLNPISVDEIEVFNAVLRWTEAEIGRQGRPVERLEYLKVSPIWEEVRFQQISSRDLSTIVYESGIFIEQEYHNLLMHVDSGGTAPCEIQCPMMRQRSIECCLMGHDHRQFFDDVIDNVTRYESELQFSTVYLDGHAKDPIGSYDSVFYWQAGGSFTDKQVFFRSFDRFVAAGGGLVVAALGFSYGRMEETEHIPIIEGGYGARTHLQMKQPPNEPDHPVTDGVKKIDGGNNNCDYFHIQVKQGLDPAPVVLAYWDNDVPMVIAWDRPVKGRVVVLNFFPVSTATWEGGWPTTPDNDVPHLIQNALRWTARCSAEPHRKLMSK